MNHLDDDFASQPVTSRPNMPALAALIGGAGAVVLLLWMSFNLSSQVSRLEETVNTLQSTITAQNDRTQSKEIASRLDSITQALADYLKSQANNQPESDAQANTLTSPAVSSPSSLSPKLPIQPVPERSIPATPAGQSDNNRSLPDPISSEGAPAPQSHSGAGWVVNLTSVSDTASAKQEVARLSKMGIKAESSRAVSKGKVWYRIRVPGFASHDEATAARPSLEKRLDIHDTWVGRQD